jgi:hypothetical protein
MMELLTNILYCMLILLAVVIPLGIIGTLIWLGATERIPIWLLAVLLFLILSIGYGIGLTVFK